MMAAELYLDRILGRLVIGRDNKPVGRIEEMRAVASDGQIEVREFVIGAAGLLERLGLGLRLIVGFRTRGKVARWDQLDLADPERPRLTCATEDLAEA